MLMVEVYSGVGILTDKMFCVSIHWVNLGTED